MREFSLTLDARPAEVTAIAIAVAFHEGLRRMGRHEDFPGFVKSAANILAPVHWDLGHVDEHYFPISACPRPASRAAYAGGRARWTERRNPGDQTTTRYCVKWRLSAVSCPAHGRAIAADKLEGVRDHTPRS